MGNLTRIQSHIATCRTLAGKVPGTDVLSYLLGLAEEEARCLLGTRPDTVNGAPSIEQAFDALYEIAATGNRSSD